MMIRAIAAGFLGSFLAMVMVAAIAFVFAERTVRTMSAQISEQIETRLADARERVAAARLRERGAAGAESLAAALEAGRGRRALLAAFGECVSSRTEGGERPATAIEACMDEFAWVEP